MKMPDRNNLRRFTIRPGEYFVTSEEAMIFTLLGSCVSACLYDPVEKVIGMNHFLFGNRHWAGNMPYRLTDAGRYGIHAMKILIREMLNQGARRANLHAKAFGGSSLLRPSGEDSGFFCAGDVNARFIKDFLENEGIPLVSEDLGGERGRVICFYYSDYSVYVRKIRKTFNTSIMMREMRLRREGVVSPERKTLKPAVFD